MSQNSAKDMTFATGNASGEEFPSQISEEVSRLNSEQALPLYIKEIIAQANAQGESPSFQDSNSFFNEPVTPKQRELARKKLEGLKK